MRGTGLVHPFIWREYGHERSTLEISSPMAKFPNHFEFVAKLPCPRESACEC